MLARDIMDTRFHNIHPETTIADAVADLGDPGAISEVFGGFQKYLYQEVA
jgi:hypothetical protein